MNMTKQYIELHHLETLLNDGNLEKGKLNAIVSPMGSGKSTLIKQVLEVNDSAMVLYPYITSKRDFKEHNNYTNYFTAFVTSIVKGVSKNLTVEDFYFEYIVKLNQWLNEHRPSAIILDEGDFFFIQAKAMKNYGSTKFKNVDYNILAGKLTYITLQMMAEHTLLLSFSASLFKVPHDLADEYFYDSTMIKYHVIDLNPNTVVNSFTVIPATNNNTSVYQIVKDWIGTSKHTLVYRNKWNKVLMDVLMDTNPLYILRTQNAPYVLDETTGTRIPYGSVLVDNYREIGSDESQLSDELYLNHSVIGIGVSSSRAVSLTTDYGSAKIVIFADGVSASAIQVLGRFRNTLVDVLWVGSFDIDKAESFDPYIKQYVKSVTIQSTQLNLLSTVVKDDVNQYLATVGTDTPTFDEYQSQGYVGTSKQFYFFVKELGYVLKNSRAKGMRIGKAVGQAVSPKTLAKQQALKEFLTTNPKGSYSLYQSVVSKELQYSVNQFGANKKSI